MIIYVSYTVLSRGNDLSWSYRKVTSINTWYMDRGDHFKVVGLKNLVSTKEH